MYILLFLIIWTHFLQTSNNTKFLVFDETYFQNNNSNNDLVYHSIDDIGFDFNFIANYKEIENQIFIVPTNVITIKDYNPSQHDKLIKNLVQIKKELLLFYFKNSWSQNQFDLFCGCLSYAQSQGKNVIVTQGTIIDLLTFVSIDSTEINNQETINMQRFLSISKQKIIINVLVNKSKKEEIEYIYNFTEQTIAFDMFWQQYQNDIDNTNIAKKLNSLFQESLEEFRTVFINEHIKATTEEIVNEIKKDASLKERIIIDSFDKITKGMEFYDRNKLAINSLFKYGIILYSSYSLLKSNYQSIGSLKSFPSIPKTTAGKAKTLLNIYSVYSVVGMLYHYARNSFNWLKNKVYGTQK